VEINTSTFNTIIFKELIERALETKQWIVKSIYDSRSKDYENEFRKMVYDNNVEMEKVIGKIEDNIFIGQQNNEFIAFTAMCEKILSNFNLK
jgi:hypothetical protein